MSKQKILILKAQFLTFEGLSITFEALMNISYNTGLRYSLLVDNTCTNNKNTKISTKAMGHHVIVLCSQQL